MVRINLIVALALGLIGGAIGCDNSKQFKSVQEVKQANPLADHDHGAKGPHGGGIVELGEEEYHGEIVVDHDSHSLTVYVLGKDAKTAEPITSTEVTVTPEGKDALTLKAVPQQGDGEGKSSKFVLEDDQLVHALMDAGFVHGDLRITIGDKPYLGHIDYHLDGGHDHHDHDEKPAEKK
ncbi:hypothetical protein [Schlesneria paludicola]|uniref:hypothetical protein n=1 Tax=Schlesneria paludicola TaxID=360056 RepID=UPI00029AA7F8|nr:hypothetical protein [Schlesneria paludicola]